MRIVEEQKLGTDKEHVRDTSLWKEKKRHFFGMFPVFDPRTSINSNIKIKTLEW